VGLLFTGPKVDSDVKDYSDVKVYSDIKVDSDGRRRLTTTQRGSSRRSRKTSRVSTTT